MRNTKTISVTREITFDVEVTLDWEYDDDGCGSPSSSGNSMTGYRGKYLVVTDYTVDQPSLIAAANAELDFDCDEFIDAAADAQTEAAEDVDDNIDDVPDEE
jgi:hypothetical protein